MLASRLSADRRVKVLLLESGVEGINRDVMGMPATAFEHHRTNIDWKYMSEPQKICCQSFENQVMPHIHVVGLFMHHCLYHILPPARHLDSVRERGHPFSLPDFSTSIHKKSFVVRTLYKLI